MKKRSKSSGIALIAAIITLLVLFTWQMGIFNMGGTTVTATGFAKIKPQLAGTGMNADGTFIGVLTNGVGTAIEIEDITVTVNGVVCKTAFAEKSRVAAGQNFQMKAKGCAQGYPGDVYDANVKIGYSVSIGGMVSDHIETGRLRGPLEGGYGSKPSKYTDYNPYYQPSSYSSSNYRPAYYRLHKSFDFGAWWPIVVIVSIASLIEADRVLKSMTASQHVHLMALYSLMFLLCSTMIFIFGIDYVVNNPDNPDMLLRLRYGWLLEAIVYWIVGAGLYIGAEVENMRLGAKNALMSAVTAPILTIYAYTALVMYPYRSVVGILSMSSKAQLADLSWIIELIVLATMAIAYYVLTKVVMQKSGKYGRPNIVYNLRSIASIYWIGTICAFIYGMNTIIYSVGALDIRGLAIAIVLAMGGIVCYVLGRKRPKAQMRQEPEEPVVEL